MVRWRPELYDVEAWRASDHTFVEQSLGTRPEKQLPAPGDVCYVLTTASRKVPGMFVACGRVVTSPRAGPWCIEDPFNLGEQRPHVDQVALCVRLKLWPCQDDVTDQLRRNLASRCRRTFTSVSGDAVKQLGRNLRLDFATCMSIV